ncbi:ABC transporter substrate-binding protein [Roseomonas alkaliterrae]|uniref:Peptide/nickel transport system substrate-binding protein n=1 Tax=Neoroseomonas alkaliterrae TaxID=1452450 RepID=A0A840XWH7_9PROT|nr:ABC transporter substrate-binding protein [Neoroseomonas alkaliterrae]MBB5690979.1 peptide/nickel transport system substrate-binding protein [Neoroseomonas alkaliterrae]MBR0674647.1 ABC transporter substrate-binding protein [Neoroseomonas alkaliterrae]
MVRQGRRVLAGAAAALLALLGTQAEAQQAPSGTLRIVLVGALPSLDPVVSTAAIVRNHGFMVYDQLFAFDSRGVARPQMVERHEVSPDGMTHRFTLREGLAFHDGQPVRAADAVASIRRWGQRDIAGRALLAATAALEVVDERSFSLRLSRPFGLVAETLARPTASALFVMPERIAATPASTAITDATGSGPFIFRQQDFLPGERAVYLRNPAYRPRSEPADGLAGGKVVHVERIEWLGISDPATQAAALQSGEIDFIESPSPDVLPVLARNRNIRTFALNPVGSMVWLRPNHHIPPFNHPRARQALLHLVNQLENLQAIGVPPPEQVPYCPAYFLCGTPFESDAGASGLREINLDRARALLREAGYNGERVVFLNAADWPANNAVVLTMAANMRRAGINVDVVATDWATVTQRRNRREPIEQGGWNLFVTIANVLDAQNPLVNVYLAATCESAPAGWPCDAELERLRASWWEESDPAKRQEILHRVHARAYEVLPYINAGQYRTLAAHRTNIEGLRPTIIPVFWGVTKR